jgi:hypothetical protein
MALVQDDVGGLVEALEHAHDVAAVVGHDLYYLVHHAIQHGRHRCSAMGARCRAMRVAALCGATEGNRGTGRLVSDQISVIRENPASRGTEASAEVLVGPPWRMESNAGPQQWY